MMFLPGMVSNYCRLASTEKNREHDSNTDHSVLNCEWNIIKSKIRLTRINKPLCGLFVLLIIF